MKDAAVKAAKDPNMKPKDQDRTEQKPDWVQYWTVAVTEVSEAKSLAGLCITSNRSSLQQQQRRHRRHLVSSAKHTVANACQGDRNIDHA